jgi:hypothetical protein
MAIPKLPGWTPLGGTSRRYRAANGRTVSRRNYENKVLKRKGWRSRYEAERFQKTSTFVEAKRRLRTSGGGSRKTLTIFDEYAAVLRDIDWETVNANWDLIAKEGRPVDKSPNGLLATNLVLIGLRKEEWEWDAGATPTGVTAIG